MKKKFNIAIISENDKVWALDCWDNSIPKIKKKHKVSGFWLCKTKSKNQKSVLYYIRTFGFWIFIKLALLKIYRTMKIFLLINKKSSSFQKLCSKENIPFHTCNTPNDKLFIDWIKKNKVDILIIMVPFIIKSDLIKSLKIGVINKHSSLLPENKGIFPYFWAFIKDQPQGITFHLVSKKIDAGNILLQKRVATDKFRSMIEFYKYVFSNYPDMVLKSINNLITKKIQIQKNGGSYHSYPTNRDYQKFKKKNGNIITLRDIID